MAKVFLLVGSSCAGKSTVQDALAWRFPDMHMAKGVWTRPHRDGEDDATADSLSVSVEEFLAARDAGLLTAVNQVHGDWYGTRKSEFTDPIAQGKHVLRIVSDQGAVAVERDLPLLESVTIYLAVPIWVTLRRLLERGDDTATIVRRIRTAEEEKAFFRNKPFLWDYVVNGDQSRGDVADEVAFIIRSEMTAFPPWSRGA